jgi:hypothetical protein
LDNCFTAFIVLGAGMILGGLLFFCECCSRLTKLNVKLLEAYDRGDQLLDGSSDVLESVRLKDAIIEDLSVEVLHQGDQIGRIFALWAIA